MAKWFPRLRPLLPAIVLLALVLAAYFPVIWHGGFIWDDPDYIVHNPTLRDLNGLAMMWIHPTSLPQYYPMVHTTFWVEYQICGVNPRIYHIDNVLLHALATILIWRIALRLKIPGAFLAAAIFAVHPVGVESVAWATERKNVLSLVLYLLALREYLKFDESGNGRSYFLALVLFILALLSKSVTCSLPAAILLIFYYRRGTIRRRDVLGLIPFFLLGAAMALVTGMLEREHVGASGHEFQWTAAQRCVIAGRAVWFYAGKLLWPANLTFIYPKWKDLGLSLVYFPLAVIAVVLSLFLLRRRIGRGPLVAVLLFIGTLLPALGFINVYPMRYSFVADHFQYQASIGLIVLFVAVGTIVFRGMESLGTVLGVAIVAMLGLLTAMQCRIYQNPATLWQDTVEKNPTSYMAWGNLGEEWAERSNVLRISADEKAEDRVRAKGAYQHLIELAPNEPLAHWKWGIIHEFDGDLSGALDEFNEAIAIDPTFTPAMNSAGTVLLKMDRKTEAENYFRRAIAVQPAFAEPHFNLGVVLEESGDVEGAIEQYRLASGKPDYADPDFNLANLYLTKKNRADLAIPYYALAVAADPNRADIRVNYASALKVTGNVAGARQQCAEAMRIDPSLRVAKQLWGSLN